MRRRLSTTGSTFICWPASVSWWSRKRLSITMVALKMSNCSTATRPPSSRRRNRGKRTASRPKKKRKKPSKKLLKTVKKSRSQRKNPPLPLRLRQMSRLSRNTWATMSRAWPFSRFSTSTEKRRKRRWTRLPSASRSSFTISRHLTRKTQCF